VAELGIYVKIEEEGWEEGRSGSGSGVSGCRSEKDKRHEYIPVLRTLLGSSNSDGFILPAAKMIVLTGERATQTSGERDESFSQLLLQPLDTGRRNAHLMSGAKPSYYSPQLVAVEFRIPSSAWAGCRVAVPFSFLTRFSSASFRRLK
jgi:hypothetical protein